MKFGPTNRREKVHAIIKWDRFVIWRAVVPKNFYAPDGYDGNKHRLGAPDLTFSAKGVILPQSLGFSPNNSLEKLGKFP